MSLWKWQKVQAVPWTLKVNSQFRNILTMLAAEREISAHSIHSVELTKPSGPRPLKLAFGRTLTPPTERRCKEAVGIHPLSSKG